MDDPTSPLPGLSPASGRTVDALRWTGFCNHELSWNTTAPFDRRCGHDEGDETANHNCAAGKDGLGGEALMVTVVRRRHEVYPTEFNPERSRGRTGFQRGGPLDAPPDLSKPADETFLPAAHRNPTSNLPVNPQRLHTEKISRTKPARGAPSSRISGRHHLRNKARLRQHRHGCRVADRQLMWRKVSLHISLRVITCLGDDNER